MKEIFNFFKKHAVVWTAIGLAYLAIWWIGSSNAVNKSKASNEDTEQLIEATVKQTIYQMQLDSSATD